MEEHELTLESIGYYPHFAAHFEAYSQQGLRPARVVFEGRSDFRVLSECGEIPATLIGKLLYASDGRDNLPVIGDWVVVDILDESPKRAIIYAILPRVSVLSRKEAGRRIREQPIAANIDTIFIAMGLDGNFNLRRVERYLALALESGAEPVVLLTKADLCMDVAACIAVVERVAPGIPICAVSTLGGESMDQLDAYLAPGRTVVLLGSSGVGKSTIINYLMGDEAQSVNGVRQSDSMGRHTTTNRRIFITPSGTLVVDTPGMRELQLWNASDGLGEAFSDIEEIAASCRFIDCRHESEPGCAVRRAVEDGCIDSNRMENYCKMLRELQYLELRQETSPASAERVKWKQIHKEARHFKKGQ